MRARTIIVGALLCGFAVFADAPPIAVPARFPAGCDGKKVLVHPLIEAKRAGTAMARTLQLRLTFCDGSMSVEPIGTTDAAWILPWWSKVELDPEGPAAGALFSARTHASDGQQITLRVTAQAGFLSVWRASRPWTIERSGALGIGPLQFAEDRRIPLPAKAQVEVVR